MCSSTEKLRRANDLERADASRFQSVDPDFVYVAYAFLFRSKWFQIHAKRTVLTALRNLLDARRSKCNQGMQGLVPGQILDCSGLTDAEITWYRERATCAMEGLGRMCTMIFYDSYKLKFVSV